MLVLDTASASVWSSFAFKWPLGEVILASRTQLSSGFRCWRDAVVERVNWMYRVFPGTPRGGSGNFLFRGGWGEGQTLVQKPVWIRFCVRSTFLWQITSPPYPLPPVEVVRYNSLIPYFTRKGYIIVDQLGKHSRPRVSQSVNAGHRWRRKYCFASRGEQIIGGYQNQWHFWMSLEFSLVAKCNARFNKKN